MRRFTDFAFTGKCRNTLIYFGVFVGIFMLLMGVYSIVITMIINAFSAPTAPLTFESLQSPASNNVMLASVISFIPTFITMWFVIPIIHKRKFLTFNSVRRKFSFKRYFIAIFVIAIIYAISFCIEYYFTDHDYVYNFDKSSFLKALPIALLILPIQTYVEEFFFRAYLLQGVASGTKNILVSILITSSIFALLHSFNPEVSEYGALNVIGSIFIMGLGYTLITVLDGGVEISSGLHAFNNISACLFVGMETNALGAKPLFTTNTVSESMMLPGAIIQTVVIILILFLIFRWKNFSDLTHKYSNEEIESISSESELIDIT
ncbi:MAG: lysostaphin resistance A-like protein [Bacteroidales bacterium]